MDLDRGEHLAKKTVKRREVMLDARHDIIIRHPKF